MAAVSEVNQQQVLRVTDIAQEPLEILLPIYGYEEMPLVSLEEAVEKLVPLLPRVQTYAHTAKERCKKIADTLTLTHNESAAVMLYTMGWAPLDKCLYNVLNATLRLKDREKLKPWFLYLRLLLNALFRLPSISRTVYRGVKLDLSEQYLKGDTFVWWGCTSCTVAMGVLQSEQFLGKKDIRTMFTIDCLNGKDICKYSYYSSEDEILLLPATQFQIIDSLDQGDLKIVQLQEIVPRFPLLQPVPLSLDKLDQVIKTTAKTEATAKFWLDLQFHDSDQQQIVKPNEIPIEIKDYPPSIINDDLSNRIQGSMFGLAIGDAVGAHVEFKTYSYLQKNPVTDLQGGGTWGLEKGQFTDDTSMALCLANSLIVCHDFVPYDQLVRYKWWYRNGYMSSTGHCFDIGAATRQSIQEFEARQKTFAQEYDIPLEQMDSLSNPHYLQQFDVYCSKKGEADNGALMRLAPVPLFFYRDPAKAVEYSGISGKITHGDKKAYDACRYYGALIVAILSGAKKDDLISNTFYNDHKEWFGDDKLHPDIMSIAQGSYKKKGGYSEGIRGKEYVVNALEAALWAFWNDQNSFEKGVLDAVNLGDDTDTTAAIYGQLAGAYYGYKKLPEKWRENIYAKNFVLCLSNWIAYEGEIWFKKQTGSDVTEPLINSNPTTQIRKTTNIFNPGYYSSSNNDKTINILLLGKSGVGKSTLINTFKSYLKFNRYEDFRSNISAPFIVVAFRHLIRMDSEERIIPFGTVDRNENFDHSNQSTTQQCKLYNFPTNNNEKICLIDTPGFGQDNDDIIMQHILSRIRNLTHLNVICILIQSDDNQLDDYQVCLTKLFHFLGNQAINNIVFCFTKTVSKDVNREQRNQGIQLMLDTLPTPNIPFNEKMIFDFDSTFFIESTISRRFSSFIGSSNQTSERSWQISNNGWNRLLNHIRQNLHPFDIQHGSQKAQLARIEINQLIRPLLETVRNNIRNILLFRTGYRNDSIELSPVSLTYPSAICYSCKRPNYQCGPFWIISDSPHEYRGKCDTCSCSSDQHIQTEYRLECKYVTNQTQQRSVCQEDLLDIIVHFAQFLLEGNQKTNNDPFLLYLNQMINEERSFSSNLASHRMNLALYNQLTDFRQHYQRRLNLIKQKSVGNDLDINDLIEKVKQIPVIKIQLDASRKMEEISV